MANNSASTYDQVTHIMLSQVWCNVCCVCTEKTLSKPGHRLVIYVFIGS